MLSAEAAILFHLKTVGVIFFVFLGVVIALFALRAGQCNFHSHFSAPPLIASLFVRRHIPKNAHKKINLQKRYIHHSISAVARQAKFLTAVRMQGFSNKAWCAMIIFTIITYMLPCVYCA
jgi:hypothetical protein